MGKCVTFAKRAFSQHMLNVGLTHGKRMNGVTGLTYVYMRQVMYLKRAFCKTSEHTLNGRFEKN